MSHRTTVEIKIGMPVRVLAALCGVWSVAVGCAGLYLAFFAVDASLWYAAMFSGLTVGCGVVFLGLGAGMFADGRGIALISCAGVIGAGCVMGYLELRANTGANPEAARQARLWLMAALAAGGLPALLAAFDAVLRRPGRVLRHLVIGLVLSAVLGGLLYGAYVVVPGSGPAVTVPVLLIGGVIALALCSAAGHQLISAFEAVSENRTAKTAVEAAEAGQSS